jgi:hypothetical protein
MEVEIDWMQAMQDWRKRQGVTRSKIKLTDAANAAGFLGSPGSSPISGLAGWVTTCICVGVDFTKRRFSNYNPRSSGLKSAVLYVLYAANSMYSTRRTTNCKLEFLRGGVTL